MTPPNGVASEAVSPAVARARVRGTTSMRSEAWRRFRKHRLASIGAIAGQMGGSVDHVLMRFTDLFLSLPQLPLLLLLAYLFRDALKKALGPEMGVFMLMVVVIGGLRWMPVARLVRAQFLSLREKEFVEAARGLGAAPL